MRQRIEFNDIHFLEDFRGTKSSYSILRTKYRDWCFGLDVDGNCSKRRIGFVEHHCVYSLYNLLCFYGVQKHGNKDKL